MAGVKPGSRRNVYAQTLVWEALDVAALAADESLSEFIISAARARARSVLEAARRVDQLAAVSALESL